MIGLKWRRLPSVDWQLSVVISGGRQPLIPRLLIQLNRYVDHLLVQQCREHQGDGDRPEVTRLPGGVTLGNEDRP